MGRPGARAQTNGFLECRNRLGEFVLKVADQAEALPNLPIFLNSQAALVGLFRAREVARRLGLTGRAQIRLRAPLLARRNGGPQQYHREEQAGQYVSFRPNWICR